MKFKYKAKSSNGKIIHDFIEASDEATAVASLRENKFFIISITPLERDRFSDFFVKKVSLKEKIIFTQQLAMMIRSGLSVTEALEALRDQADNKTFSMAINNIISDVRGGLPVSEAFAKHPEIFSEIYINMTKAGEQSGKLDLVLDRLAEQLEKDYDLTRKIKGALSYPIFVMIVLVIVMILVITVIIPQLKSVFDDAGVQLPLLTRIIIKISQIFQHYGIYLLIAAGLIAGGCFYLFKKPSVRKVWDRNITKFPVIGPLLVKTYISRFSRTFSSLVSSGLPILDAITISSKVIGNIVYAEELLKVVEKVKSGQLISASLKQSPLFPKMVGQLSTVGEKSGNLDEVFEKIADFFDRDIDNITANLSSMLEPVLMAVMGVGIGLIVISILQPIYGLTNAIN